MKSETCPFPGSSSTLYALKVRLPARGLHDFAVLFIWSYASCEDFRPRLLVRGHRYANSAWEPVGDLREMRDQDDLLEELAHPQEFLDEQFPRHLRVQGPEVAFVDEQGLHAAERPADLWHRGELPGDREPQGRVDLGLLAPAELRHIVPLAVDALHEDPDSVAASLLVRLEADPAKPAIRELGEILRCLDFEFRQELLDRVHHDPALMEYAVHEHVVDLELEPKRVPGAFRLVQFLRVPCEPRDPRRPARPRSTARRRAGEAPRSSARRGA